MASEQEESKESCGKSGCGSRGGKSCCGTKSLLVVLLFLVGGIIGYLMGTNCAFGQKSDCDKGMIASSCPMAESVK